MLANHDPLTHPLCESLKTTCMGLGLVRLLQDAKRFEEARATLHLIENVNHLDQPGQKPSDASRSKRITRPQSSRSARIEAA